MKPWPAAIVVVVCGCATRAPQDAPLPPSPVRIDVAENATLFTLFALLNAAGYDLENREEMHPARVAVREALATELGPELRERLRRFYEAHPRADAWSYSVVAMATQGPPAFAPSSEWAEIQGDERFGELAELHGLLRDFYGQVDVPALYASVRPQYSGYVRAYRDAVHEQAAAVMRYCRIASVSALAAVPEGERANPLVIPNLLDSYEHAFSFVLGGRFVSVEGPQARIGYNPHEFVHAITNPVVYGPATKAIEARLRPIAEAVRAESVEAFVDEDLVRAISLRYLAAGRPERLEALTAEMLEEYHDGHPLERFFWEQLAEYERSGADIRAYYPTMLSRLDPESEWRRWNEATAAH